ncbi:hypothetical protein Caci_4223 [Catenulispora acidiphila DSM 44928]|uniref:Uncharacterized protein n=1 Tax=Catenulispora acidiphila (strain DSM 44928 / JCM 14897 / NBRC 102108 / NRRL B-24433 / ID139908) TaxID=479433 RepID=C7QI42_CATAD|nr:hypothetical protein [Catenulispora acidiphila]ACU73087.1 hypothetical protein Caci_4223 [Catenulispora acidiphila DSM 44928]
MGTSMRFNVPPGWPAPPDGWIPDPGWQPDPSWPAAPVGWRFWVDGPTDAPTSAGSRLDEQLLKVAQWTRQRAGKHEELPAVAFSGPDPAAKWFGLAASVAKFGPVHSALSGALNSAVPGGDQVLDLVKSLYAIEDEQSRVLHSIDANVTLLKEGPYRAGRLLLSEAHRLGDRDQESHRLLESAKDRFYDAQPLASSVQERTLVELHLALVWLALSRTDDARYWLEQAYQSARVVIDSLTQQATDVKVLKSKWATTALSIYYPAGLFVVPLKLKRLWSADRANGALNAFLPVANSIAACLNSLNERPVVPALELTAAYDGTRLLREVGLEG